MQNSLTVQAKTRKIVVDNKGFNKWESVYKKTQLVPSQTALVIVDMWDKHWSSGATARSTLLAPQINQIANYLRSAGVLIVHSPSDCQDFYANEPARKRFLELKIDEQKIVSNKNGKNSVNAKNYICPVDSSDGGSDTPKIDLYEVGKTVWTRQNSIIEIDQSKDFITGDEGEKLLNYFAQNNIKNILYAGVHTNMCILWRSFGIMNALNKGLNPFLIRNLTDAMYNPQKPPFVSHKKGTKLIIKAIEKSVCPTVKSLELFSEICKEMKGK